MSNPAPPIIRLEDTAVRVCDRILLRGMNWEIRPGEHWAVIGPNGSGKTSLARALAGELPFVRGRVVRNAPDLSPCRVGYVSFELHRRLIAREEDRDEGRWFAGDGGAASARSMFPEAVEKSRRMNGIVDLLGVGNLMDRPLRALSTGEMRRMLMARALSFFPHLLILDEPFDGLDIPTRKRMEEILHHLMGGDLHVILITHRRSEILPRISHILRLSDGGVAAMGKKEDLLPGFPMERAGSPPRFVKPHRADEGVPVVRMRNVRVRYGEKTVISGLDWTVNAGENWAVAGPNGAGKTTLLRLISGDHLQAYANDIEIFGRPRGTGESIWEIKQKIGLVSPEFQIRYRKPVTVSDVVASGFFDSVGLYRMASRRQRWAADEWMERLGLSFMADRRFDRLSCGEQRMALLARALVKNPQVLILDEPCQGLDPANREKILSLIDSAGASSGIQLLYVTHHPAQIPGCITHMLRLEGTAESGFTAVCGAIDHAPGHPVSF